MISFQSPRKILTDVNMKKVRKMSVGDDSQTNGKSQDTNKESNGIDSTKAVAGTSLANKPAVPFDPSIEPLLKENPRRFVIFPIQYLDIWQMYKKVRFVQIVKCYQLPNYGCNRCFSCLLRRNVIFS